MSLITARIKRLRELATSYETAGDAITMELLIEAADTIEMLSEKAKMSYEYKFKYQTMEEVLEKVWHVPSCILDEAECLNEIMETYRTVRDPIELIPKIPNKEQEE